MKKFLPWIIFKHIAHSFLPLHYICYLSPMSCFLVVQQGGAPFSQLRFLVQYRGARHSHIQRCSWLNH
jgi:hypothetical protein